MVDVSHPVVIDFTNLTSPFEQLWPTTHRALLPVVGKPVLIHVLERLRNRGFRHFRIARHLQQPFVRHRLGNGEEWGLKLRYSDLAGDELVEETVAVFGRCLYLYGDELLDPRVDLDAPASKDDVPDINAPGMYSLRAGGEGYEVERLRTGQSKRLSCVADYHRLSFRLCADFADGDTLPGAQLHRSAQLDWKTVIAPDVLVGGSCFVGKHCRIDRGAFLEKNCVLGNGVYVDKKARLSNCVVLPNTYVGKQVVLRDCVVGAQGVVHVSGQFAEAASPAVLRKTRANEETKTGLPQSMSRFHGPVARLDAD